MRQTRKPARLRPLAQTLPECLRQFLTPGTWKQAQRRRRPGRSQCWRTQPLVLTLVLMTWCCGDSAAERFESARAVGIACRPKRQRPGKAAQGFHKARARLPMAVLRAVAAGVRRRIARELAAVWHVHGFVPLGCDGSRLECPRAAELERHLGQAGKAHAAPTLWVTAVVHLRLGVPWAWRWGKGTASERAHLTHLLADLPRRALLVADAGYVGFALAQALVAARLSFLIRTSSAVKLYAEKAGRLGRRGDGRCYYWPEAAQRRGVAPVLVRLLRVRGKHRRADVWLLTNVLDERRLSVAAAGRFYRWRWENEGFFRTYKRTLAKVKLHSRAVRLAHREAEGSMPAAQLLLAQGAAGLRPAPRDAGVPCSPRQVLRAFRQETQALLPREQPGKLGRRLTQARRERRPRRRGKVRRDWPRRKPTRPPGPPTILKLTGDQKRLIHKLKDGKT